MADETEITQEDKDYTMWWWIGIAAALAVMCGALVVWGGMSEDVTTARAKHILIAYDTTDPADRARALELVQELRQRILNGEKFEKVAKEYSNDEYSAPLGGDLGYKPPGTFQGDFEYYIWNGEIGEVSDVVKTSYGYHLIMVVDRQISEADRIKEERKQRLISEDAESTGDTSAE